MIVSSLVSVVDLGVVDTFTNAKSQFLEDSVIGKRVSGFGG